MTRFSNTVREESVVPAIDLKSFEEVRDYLSILLNLRDPITRDVVFAAIDDPLYLHHLLVCRDEPKFLEVLIRSASETDFEANTKQEHNFQSLSTHAVKSFWNWAKIGFSFVDDSKLQSRLNACKSCPNFVVAPSNMLYKVVAGSNVKERNMICQLCGCVVSKKALLPSESCPSRDPAKPQFTRWGESINLDPI